MLQCLEWLLARGNCDASTGNDAKPPVIHSTASVPYKNKGSCIFSVAAELLGSAFFALGSTVNSVEKGRIINLKQIEKAGGLGRLCSAGIWDLKGGAVCNSAE